MSAHFLEQMAVGSRQRVDVARRACADSELLGRA
jgi:ABC-type lipoprotein export system ATPase subunit